LVLETVCELGGISGYSDGFKDKASSSALLLLSLLESFDALSVRALNCFGEKRTGLR
jgi:hypothetical protein